MWWPYVTVVRDVEQDKSLEIISLCGGRISRKINNLLRTYIQKHVTQNKMYGQVSVNVQGQQGNWFFLHDSRDFKAAAILGSCVCHTQCVHVMAPKTGKSKCNI
jgi:hypothetical protein